MLANVNNGIFLDSGLASDIDFSNKVMKYGHFHHPSVFPEAIRSATKRFRSHDTNGTMLRR